jgi:hypothetical protein
MATLDSGPGQAREGLKLERITPMAWGVDRAQRYGNRPAAREDTVVPSDPQMRGFDVLYCEASIENCDRRKREGGRGEFRWHVQQFARKRVSR